MEVLRAASALLALAIFCLISPCCRSQETQEDVMPYLLFTTHYGIHRMYLNGSNIVEDVIWGPYGFRFIDYHYSLNLMFWINETCGCIMKAKLSDGSAVVVLIGDMNDPTDLSVDWINSKLYWVDRDICEIGEYDLVSNTRRFVMSTGSAETSNPLGIVVYPYPDYGWLYWTDLKARTLEMGSIMGSSRETLRSNLQCIWPVTIDYSSHTIYWVDYCVYAFESLRMDGDRFSHSYPFDKTVFFVSSIAKYGNNLYWVEPDGIYTISLSGGDYITLMESSSTMRPLSLQVVHSSSQPPAETYVEIIMDTGNTTFNCSSPCHSEHGTCVPPGMCACKPGWMGDMCSADIDECTMYTGLCEDICNNTEGSYFCACSEGYVLSNDSRTCDDIDECTMYTGLCEDICNNTEGSYFCACSEGYVLSNDSRTCDEIFSPTTADPEISSTVNITPHHMTIAMFPSSFSSFSSSPIISTFSSSLLTFSSTHSLSSSLLPSLSFSSSSSLTFSSSSFASSSFPLPTSLSPSPSLSLSSPFTSLLSSSFSSSSFSSHPLSSSNEPVKPHFTSFISSSHLTMGSTLTSILTPTGTMTSSIVTAVTSSSATRVVTLMSSSRSVDTASSIRTESPVSSATPSSSLQASSSSDMTLSTISLSFSSPSPTSYSPSSIPVQKETVPSPPVAAGTMTASVLLSMSIDQSMTMTSLLSTADLTSMETSGYSSSMAVTSQTMVVSTASSSDAFAASEVSSTTLEMTASYTAMQPDVPTKIDSTASIHTLSLSPTSASSLSATVYPTPTLDDKDLVPPYQDDGSLHKGHLLTILTVSVSVPCTLALIGLLIVLICYYQRNTISWSPNNDSKQQPNYNVAENGNVTVNSIRSFDSYVA